MWSVRARGAARLRRACDAATPCSSSAHLSGAVRRAAKRRQAFPTAGTPCLQEAGLSESSRLVPLQARLPLPNLSPGPQPHAARPGVPLRLRLSDSYGSSVLPVPATEGEQHRGATACGVRHRHPQDSSPDFRERTLSRLNIRWGRKHISRTAIRSASLRTR